MTFWNSLLLQVTRNRQYSMLLRVRRRQINARARLLKAHISVPRVSCGHRGKKQPFLIWINSMQISIISNHFWISDFGNAQSLQIGSSGSVAQSGPVRFGGINFSLIALYMFIRYILVSPVTPLLFGCFLEANSQFKFALPVTLSIF